MRKSVFDVSKKVKTWASLYSYRIWLSYKISGAPPRVLGIWGEGLFIFRELGSTDNYFRGAGEQAYTFGDLGSTAKK